MGAGHARAGLVTAAFILTSVFVVASVPASSAGTAGSSIKPTVALIKPTVYVSGLNNPNRISFDQRGDLYIAEAGTGGNQRTTKHACPQVPPLGPVRGGYAHVHLYIGVPRSYDVTAGSAVVWQFNPRSNQLTVFAKNLTDLMGLTFGPDSALVCS
jgi:hypothetical protein